MGVKDSAELHRYVVGSAQKLRNKKTRYTRSSGVAHSQLRFAPAFGLPASVVHLRQPSRILRTNVSLESELPNHLISDAAERVTTGHE